MTILRYLELGSVDDELTSHSYVMSKPMEVNFCLNLQVLQ